MELKVLIWRKLCMGFVFDTQFLREVFGRASHLFCAHLELDEFFRSCQVTV